MPKKTYKSYKCWLALTSILMSFASSGFACPTGTTEMTVLDSQSGGGNTVVRELLGFTEVRTVIDTWISERKEICFSSLVLSKSDYGYDKKLVFAEAMFNGERTSVLPMLIQTTSIQGHHNFLGKPWVVLNLERTKEVFINAWTAAQATAAPVELSIAETPGTSEFKKAIMKQPIFDQRGDESTFSIIPVGNLLEDQVYLMTWLTPVDGGSFYARQLVLKSYFVKLISEEVSESGASRKVKVYGFSGFNAIKTPLEAIIRETPSPTDVEGRIQLMHTYLAF